MAGHTGTVRRRVRKIYVYFLKKLWYTRLDKRGRGGAPVPFFRFFRALVRAPVMKYFCRAPRAARHAKSLPYIAGSGSLPDPVYTGPKPTIRGAVKNRVPLPVCLRCAFKAVILID